MNFSKLDTFMQAMPARGIPGCELAVAKDGKIVYFIQHANVWYTSTGGVQALDTMIADLEAALIK